MKIAQCIRVTFEDYPASALPKSNTNRFCLSEAQLVACEAKGDTKLDTPFKNIGEANSFSPQILLSRIRTHGNYQNNRPYDQGIVLFQDGRIPELTPVLHINEESPHLEKSIDVPAGIQYRTLIQNFISDLQHKGYTHVNLRFLAAANSSTAKCTKIYSFETLQGILNKHQMNECLISSDNDEVQLSKNIVINATMNRFEFEVTLTSTQLEFYLQKGIESLIIKRPDQKQLKYKTQELLNKIQKEEGNQLTIPMNGNIYVNKITPVGATGLHMNQATGSNQNLFESAAAQIRRDNPFTYGAMDSMFGNMYQR